MTVWHILFPLCAVLPVIVNGRAMRAEPEHGDAFGLSLMILAIWVGQLTLSAFLPAPERGGYNAMFDFSAALAVLGSWVTAKKRWKLALLGLYLVQIYLAGAFWWGWEVFDRAIKYGFYVRANNVIWLLEIALVSGVGGWSVVRRTLFALRTWSDADRGLGAAT